MFISENEMFISRFYVSKEVKSCPTGGLIFISRFSVRKLLLQKSNDILNFHKRSNLIYAIREAS